jgi:hypothetical protein
MDCISWGTAFTMRRESFSTVSLEPENSLFEIKLRILTFVSLSLFRVIFRFNLLRKNE